MELADRNKKNKAVSRVLWGVLAANLTITVVKIILGTITGSLGVIADGFHSLVDSSSNLIGLAAIRLAGQPADDRYPYGYQRYETIGSLAIGGLLLVAAWEIIQGVFERLINGSNPEFSWQSFAFIALTLPFNILVVLLETRAGRRLNSSILLADATHTRTDLYVTGSVIASLIGIKLGLGWLDLLVAGVVVVLILRASFNIIRNAAGSLADVVGVDPKVVETTARKVPGVNYVHNVRSRDNAGAIFVDLHVKVDPAMSTSQAHAVASEVEYQVCQISPEIVDTIVHIEPSYLERSSDWEKISYGLRSIAEGIGLSLHDLHVHVNQEGEFTIELDLEIQGEVTLKEAHEFADEFEERALRFWPDAKQVVTHLEPASRKLLYPSSKADGNLTQRVRDYLYLIMNPIGKILVQSLVIEDHLSVYVKFSMPAEISLDESHARVEEIKRSLMQEFPEISRINIHVEPWSGEVTD